MVWLEKYLVKPLNPIKLNNMKYAFNDYWMNKNSKGLSSKEDKVFLSELFDKIKKKQIIFDIPTIRYHLQDELHRILDNHINFQHTSMTQYDNVDQVIDTISRWIVKYLPERIKEEKEECKKNPNKLYDPEKIFIKTVNDNISHFQIGRISKYFFNSDELYGNNTPEALFNYISSGYSIVHCNFKDEYVIDPEKTHSAKHFKETNTAFIDIDNDATKNSITGNPQKVWTLEELKNDSLVKDYALLIYPSFSFKKDVNEKCRIVFWLEETITDSKTFKLLLKGLIKHFESDSSTGSSTSIFYGNNQRTDDNNVELYSHKNFNKRLSKEKVKELILDGKSIKPSTTGITPASKSPPSSSKKTMAVAPVPATPTSSTVIGHREMTIYEVLLPDSVVGGHRVDTVSSKVNVNCPFPESHGGPDIKASAMMDSRTNSINEQSVILNCKGANDNHQNGVHRWMLPATYDDISTNDLNSIQNKDVGDFGIDFTINKLPGKANLIKSASGTGKTNALKPIIDLYKHNGKSVLFISHLRSLSFALADKFKIENYLVPNYDKKGHFKQNYSINFSKPGVCSVIGPISLINTRKDFQNYHWDYIIIDEFEQLLSQCLDGQLIKNNSEKFSADLLTFLKILINNATKTILLDADIGQLSVEFCKHLFPNNSLKNIYLYWNTYKMEKRDIYFTYHQYHLYSILKEHLDSGKKVLYTSNRREEILVIHGNIKHHYPHLRALPITKDNVNTQNVINLISDPKKFLSHWDVILYNSAISTGCSFLDTNKQFDAIFGYFVNRISPYKEKYYTQYTTSPLQNSQMLARLRSDVPIYLHINVQKVSDIEDKLSNYYKVWELNKPEVKMHLGIYEKYLEINDRFNSIYYGSLRAYYHQKGWNTELLYATLKELNDGGKTFHPVNLKIIHLRKLIDYGDIERKDIDNTTFDTFKLIKTILDKLDFDLNTLSFRRGYIINHGQKIRDFRKYCLGKKLDLDNLLDIKVPTLYDNNQKETFDNSKLFIFLYTFFKNILNLDLNVYEPWLDEQDVSKKSPAMKQKDVEVYGLEKTPYNTDDLLNFDIDAWDS